MYLKISFLIYLLALISHLQAQKADRQLTRKLEAVLKEFNGDAGIYVKNLRTGGTVSINADTLFPTASMIKIPILAGIMAKIDKGELSDTMKLTYRDSLLYAGVDILGSFKENEKIELGHITMLMLTMSDNTASLWLQSLAGGGVEINDKMQELGLSHTRVNSRTPGREAQRAEYGWGQTTPREMALLFEKMVNGEVISRAISDRMLRMTSRNHWDDVSISQIPVGIFISSKNGAVDASRSEVLYVNLPGNPYIFCICTKNNTDKSWNESNEAWRMTRNVSKLLYEYYK